MGERRCVQLTVQPYISRMRILFIGHSPHLTGAEYSMFRLIRACSQSEEVHVCSPAGGDFEDAVRDLGLPFYSFEPVYPLKLIKDQEKSCSLPFLQDLKGRANSLREKVPDVDIVHSNTSLLWEGAFLASQMNVPHVWNIREVLSHSPTWMSLLGLKSQYELMATLSDRLVCNSQALADSLPLSKEDKISVIHNGLDEPEFYSREKAREVFKKNWGIDEDVSVVLTIGHFIKEKGHDYILKMMPEILKKVPKTVFLWIGEHHWQYDEVMKESEAQGVRSSIVAPGSVPEASKLMKGADVYLLSSSTEAFPTVLLEAQLARLPILARDCGGTREIIEHGGGKIYPLDEQEELSKDLCLLLQGEWKTPEMKEYAFSMKEMYARYLQTYQECIDQFEKETLRQTVCEGVYQLSDDLKPVADDIDRVRKIANFWPLRKFWRLGHKLGLWGDLPFKK